MGNQIGAVLSVRADMRDARARTPSPPLDAVQPATAARAGAVDPLTQLARLIAQDEAFQTTARNGSRSAARESIRTDHDLAGDAALPLIGSEVSEHPAAAYHYRENADPDFSAELPKRRRGLRVFVALIGLTLL